MTTNFNTTTTVSPAESSADRHHTKAPRSIKGAAVVLGLSAIIDAASAAVLLSLDGSQTIAAYAAIEAVSMAVIAIALIQGFKVARPAAFIAVLMSCAVSTLILGTPSGVIGAIIVIKLLKRPTASAHLVR